MNRWRYHLTTLGSILLLAALVTLLAALIGVAAGSGAIPGRGVTTIPAPHWSSAP